MPYQISVEHEERIILVDLTGEVVLDDILSFMDELMEEPYLSLPCGILIDSSKADLSGMHIDDTVKIIWVLNGAGEKVKAFNLALLTGAPMEFGFHRAFEMMSECEHLPFKVLVTDDEDQARKWAMSSPRQLEAAQARPA